MSIANVLDFRKYLSNLILMGLVPVGDDDLTSPFLDEPFIDFFSAMFMLYYLLNSFDVVLMVNEVDDLT